MDPVKEPTKVQEFLVFPDNVIECRDGSGNPIPTEEFPVALLPALKEKILRGVVGRETIVSFPMGVAGFKRITVGELVDQGRLPKGDLPIAVTLPPFQSKALAETLFPLLVATVSMMPGSKTDECLRALADRARQAGLDKEYVEKIMGVGYQLMIAEIFRR